jgi:hypothetical protein
LDTPHPDFELRLIIDSAPALIHTEYAGMIVRGEP